MNIFDYYKNLFLKIIKDIPTDKLIIKKITVEMPKQKVFGDISFNAPLILASSLKKQPMQLANEIKELIQAANNDFEKIEVAKPGFINFTFKKEIFLKFIKIIDKNYGKPVSIKSNKINIEFVSANPTGPLHVGHCRGAIFGDVLSNFLKFYGHDVVKEYYINDYGNQIYLFVKSVYFRAIELQKGITFPEDQGLYPGEYIIDIANDVLKKIKNENLSSFDESISKLTPYAIKSALDIIKKDLDLMGIVHDNFVSESDIVNRDILSEAIDKLKNKGDVYTGVLPKPKGDAEDWEPREQLLFKSSKYGDDVDRALQKSDNTWTYFANDVAYHYDKLKRNFDHYINILGADHAGYVKRLSSAVNALNNNKTFSIKLSQIVKLYKSGKPFRMSKRAGDFILAKDLIDAVGKDSARFMMVYRSSNSQLDFDFDLVTDTSKDNPIFYVQYACARINSLFDKSNFDIEKPIIDAKLENLKHETEFNLIKKIVEWPKIVNLCYQNLEVHYIPYYLYELSSEFHTYWNAGKENEDLKIIGHSDKQLINSRLYLLQKLYLVLTIGLNILDVKVLKKM
ncbi:arginine--tRNA ligase [Candidatus Pelagibacter sp. HIMB1517]|uniref:arginine--tRNA ligase n=1 Tax=Candidatus Pelagibacter sp. HIMB1517 TaxID=3413341 RepID=UPI003F860007